MRPSLLSLLLLAACGRAGFDPNRAEEPGDGDDAPTPALAASSISVGLDHTCAISMAGPLLCWGENEFGQIGDGTTADRAVPVAVVGMRDARDVACGGGFTCGITSSGGATCWGSGATGRLGTGDYSTRTIPGSVVGLATGVTAVGAGESHACAITAAGVQCWGNNNNERLGVAGSNQNAPVMVPGTASATDVHAGFEHTCALLSGGHVQCWGHNNFGQVGTGSTSGSEPPTTVTNVNASALDTGANHTCVLTSTTSEVLCWGANDFGQIAGSAAWNEPSPVTVPLPGAATAVSAGTQHTCALLADGTGVCWGDNSYGQVGGDEATVAEPRAVVVDEPLRSIAAGHRHTCVTTESDRSFCWGSSHSGRLGNGELGFAVEPRRVEGSDGTLRQVSAGRAHTCVVDAAGGVRCLGRNANGQLGDGTQTNRKELVAVPGISATSVTAGDHHTCVVTTSGGLRCWGNGGSGQLGQGEYSSSSDPVTPVGFDTNAGLVMGGGSHTCGTDGSGNLSCWGSNGLGQLGIGPAGGSADSPQLVTLPAPVRALGLGGSGAHTCAVLNNGDIWCWGHNAAGQLGDNTTTTRDAPVQTLSLPGPMSDVAGAEDHSCSQSTTGAALCWGTNYAGQVGDGTSQQRNTPVAVAGLDSGVTDITTGGNTSCAIRDGRVLCWGRNDLGQVGDGDTRVRLAPVEVRGLPAERALSVEAGELHTCAVIEPGDLWCWGDNSDGQIGGAAWSSEPTPVIDPDA